MKIKDKKGVKKSSDNKKSKESSIKKCLELTTRKIQDEKEGFIKDLSKIYDNMNYFSAETKPKIDATLDDEFAMIREEILNDNKKRVSQTYPVPRKPTPTKSIENAPATAPFEIDRKNYPDAYIKKEDRKPISIERTYREDSFSTREEKLKSNKTTIPKDNLIKITETSSKNQSKKSSSELRDSVLRDVNLESFKKRSSNSFNPNDSYNFTFEDYLNFEDNKSFSEQLKKNSLTQNH